MGEFWLIDNLPNPMFMLVSLLVIPLLRLLFIILLDLVDVKIDIDPLSCCTRCPRMSQAYSQSDALNRRTRAMWGRGGRAEHVRDIDLTGLGNKIRVPGRNERRISRRLFQRDTAHRAFSLREKCPIVKFLQNVFPNWELPAFETTRRKTHPPIRPNFPPNPILHLLFYRSLLYMVVKIQYLHQSLIRCKQIGKEPLLLRQWHPIAQSLALPAFPILPPNITPIRIPMSGQPGIL